ncbi:histidinol-phosphate transaminase [Parvularcula dongshanensis]|uniref:Histidinol-phosphate aminotransferase n=1 Tax=Parvularcula dongshanensis TaxID=1173995 RepID=A0A840I2L2_9PROT|nr:histidinol-phosphate transaminase [Parvularcula dongshanensis]MBB4658290.1 histidinol-phosphate aminotransferase [Parvularcula dongshanensis]
MTTPSRPEPRPGLLDITPYKPGKAPTPAAGRKVYKLSSNESGLGPAPAALAALAGVAPHAEMYPDGAARSLKAKLGKTYDLPEENLIIGSGSDEVITLLLRAYAGEGTSIVQTRHGFSYYWIAAQGAGAEPLFAEETDLHADVDAILRTVREDTKIVFLANPNNPTGTVIPSAEVRRLREELPPQIILVLDGAYAEYMEAGDDYTDGADMVREAMASGADNVVMMRTFSKIYGLGGLRVGWAFGPSSVIDVLNRIRPPFNVNALALAAAEAALGDQGFVDRNRAHNAAERARVLDRLEGMGFTAAPSFANFLLVRMRGADEAARASEAASLLEHLESEGIMIRAMGGAWLPDYVRVSIGSEEANDAFLAAVARFVEGAA